VVDGHAYAYRAFHAIRNLSGPDGAPTNAIFGFLKALDRLREFLQPSHLVVVWDGGLADERLAELPDYKAQRPPMPEKLVPQLDAINEWLDASGLSRICQDGVEADDWIATLAKIARADGLIAVIASSDKDFMQLVAPGIHLVNPGDKPQKLWGEQEVRDKTGVGPSQVVDWLSLVGDSVDNIPGAPGVGPKTAAELLVQFGSIEELYRRLGEVNSERLRGILAQAEAVVRRNRNLIRLRDDLTLPLPLEAMRPRPPNLAAQRRLCDRWGFRSLRPPDLPEDIQQGLLL